MIKLPAGTYFVGDPMQCFDKNSRGTLINQTEGFTSSAIGKLNGYTMVAFRTKLHMGYFEDQDGEGYPVDSDLIGAVPIDMVNGSWTIEQLIPGSGRIIEFQEDFECRESAAWEHGDIWIGHIHIDTRRSLDDRETAEET